MAKQYPTLDEERKLQRAGYTHIAGLDEAGRGAWAGPVSAAAVILPLNDAALPERLRGVCDSKLCTPRQRDVLFDQIREVALAWAVSLVPASEIDEIGIVPATRQAMRQAIYLLDPTPDALLIDALRLPSIELPQRSLNKGDLHCLAIAAASILAKVARDRRMVEAGQTHPDYGFARHKGYGTAQHRSALHLLGPLSIHRRSYRPIAELVASSEGDGIASQEDEKRNAS